MPVRGRDQGVGTGEYHVDLVELVELAMNLAVGAKDEPRVPVDTQERRAFDARRASDSPHAGR